MRRVLALFVSALLCHGQVLTKVRPQPSSLKLNSIGACCHLQNDPVQLMSCANASTSMTRATAEVSLVTYLDSEKGSSFDIPDIMRFGAYMLANTAAYAEQNDYNFRWLTRATGSNYQPGDARWNKVKIIEMALDQTSGWAKDSKYLVWLDADAIVLDLGLKIEEVGNQYPMADFIASADVRQGYLNSGLLIMRNTPWLREFVSKWWTTVDRSVKCDQDAFDILYDSYQRRYENGDFSVGNIQEKVAILDRDALNSDPPAMTNQKDYNQVLHLMGEITPQREAVFSYAFSTLCKVATAPKELTSQLPIQLGVSREFLLSTASHVYSAHVNDLLEKASVVDPRPTVTAFNELSVACHHLADIYMTIDSEDSMKKYRELYKRAYEITLDWLRAFEGKLKALEDRSSLIGEYIYMLKRTAENGNDYFHSIELSDLMKKKTVASEVFQVLRLLHSILSDASKPFALHMTALMYHNLGEMMYNVFVALPEKRSSQADDVLSEGLANEQNAIDLMAQNFETTDNKSIMREYISMLHMAAIYQCTLKDYKNAMSTWNRTLDKAEKLAGGIVISYHFHHLIGYYFNAGMCDFTSEHYILARERFQRLLEIAHQIGFDPRNPPREIAEANKALSEIARISQFSPELMKPFIFDDLDEWEECQPGDVDCEEVEIDERGQVVSPKSPKIVSLEELDEWEECSDLDEDCELVEIEDEDEEEEDDDELAEIREQYAKQSRRFHSAGAEEVSPDDEDDEDELELAEIRAQYAQQSQRFRDA